MRRHLAYVMAVAAALSATMGWAVLRDANTGADLTLAARAFLDTLSAEQKATVVLPADSPLRFDWHFIPKDQRKGLQIKHMDAAQRKAALGLLRSALSQTGYDKATKIMSLEGILRELQKGQSSGPIRDPERYYYTIFGEPGETGRWALSIEGHHLSLNFAVDQGNVIASTPTFFAANPTVVREGMPGGVPVGTRVLADEELLAFQLLESLSPEQRKTAILADKAPSDIRAAGQLQSPEYATEGVAFGGLNGTQQKWLRELIDVYARNLPADLAAARLEAIDAARYDRVYFAWAGADRPGIGHYYRIQGPTFLIEFVNTQPDSAGNPASHIHSVWRDPTGDFAIPAKRVGA
jgi:hypothetical protein